MPALIDFNDAVTATNLNPNAKYAVYYMDGAFANKAAVAKQCPHAKLFGITVTGLTGPEVFAVDSEDGDLGIASTLAWVEGQIALGVKLIVVYANLDRWLNKGLLSALDHHGHRIKRWVAHYDGIRAIPSWADAEQYADPGPVDLNVALSTFFGDNDPHYERYDNRPRKVLGRIRRERPQVELYDKWRAQQTRTKHPHRVALWFLRKVLGWYAGRIRTIADKTDPHGWEINNRGFRFDNLIKRHGGERVV